MRLSSVPNNSVPHDRRSSLHGSDHRVNRVLYLVKGGKHSALKDMIALSATIDYSIFDRVIKKIEFFI